MYDSVVANVEMYSWIGLFVAAVSGGLIYDRWRIGPFVITAVLYAAAAGLCLLFDEPRIDSETFSIKGYVRQNLRGFHELFKDTSTTQISLLTITVMSGYFFAAKILGISQAKEYGLTGTGVGMLFGSGYIIAAFASRYYPALRRRFGNTMLLGVTTAAVVTSFLFAKFVGVVVGSMLIMMRIASSTTFNNARSVIMNRFISSKNRATALSTLALLSQIPFTLSFYFVGKYIDGNSPNSFALILGVLMLTLLIPQLVFVRRIFLQQRNEM